MLALLVLLVSSLTIEVGVLRSSFNGLHKLRQDGLDVDWGSSDSSSDSMEPETNIFRLSLLTAWFVLKGTASK